MKKLLLFAAMLLLSVTATLADTYNVTFDGIQITDANKDDVLGDGGSVSFSALSGYCAIRIKDLDYELTNSELIAFGSNIAATHVYDSINVYFWGHCSITNNTQSATISTVGIQGMRLMSQGVTRLIGGPNGIYSGDRLTLAGFGSLTVGSRSSAIHAYEGLKIENLAVVAVCTNEVGAIHIGNYTDSKLTLVNVEEENGYQYNYSKKYVVDSNGNPMQQVSYMPLDFSVWVAGTQVTRENMGDVLGDGQFSYDPLAVTLELYDAILDYVGTEYAAIEAYLDLNIAVNGYCSIESEYAQALRVAAFYCSIYSADGGLSTLDLISNGSYAMDIEAHLTIDGGTVNALSFSSAGLISDGSYLRLYDCTFSVEGDTYSICGVHDLYLEDGMEIDPNHAFEESLHTFYRVDDPSYAVANDEIIFSKPDDYHIEIAGTRVTFNNAGDVFGDGSVSYDPGPNVLTLTNCAISAVGERGIDSNMPGLTIRLVGHNTVTSDEEEPLLLRSRVYDHDSYGDTLSTVTITGEGDLAITGLIHDEGPAAILVSPYVTLHVLNTTISANGTTGILGESEDVPTLVKLENSTASFTGVNYGSVVDVRILLTNCALVAPAGAMVGDDRVYNSDGSLATDEVRFEPAANALDAISTDSIQKRLENGQVVIIRNGERYSVLGAKMN